MSSPAYFPRRARTRQTDLPHIGLAILATLRRLGYEVGSGVMIGIPGQTYGDLADDIEWFGRLDLDMIGVGPYLPHPRHAAGRRNGFLARDCADGRASAGHRRHDLQSDRPGPAGVSAGEYPRHHRAGHVNRHEGRELGLVRGANVLMPNLTPTKYRALYEIYPDKACIAETGEACHHCLTGRIEPSAASPAKGAAIRRIMRPCGRCRLET